VICPSLLAEVREVLTERHSMRRWINLDTAEQYLSSLQALIDLVPDPNPIEPTTRDPDDDYIIALARQHRVDYIVTGDKDLLDWPAQDPLVISPAAFDIALSTTRRDEQ
jgi:uncharacterized protein